MGLRWLFLLILVGTSPLGWGQDLAGHARALEQFKLAHWQHLVEQRPELGLFVSVVGISASAHVRLSLDHAAAPARELEFSQASASKVAVLNNLQPGRYQAEAHWTAENGEVYTAQHSFELSAGWNELELKLQPRSVFNDKLELAVWQRAPAQVGSWQRVAAWVPGLIASELRYVRHAADLPAMRWARTQCESGDNHAVDGSALLEIFHTLAQWPGESLTAQAYAGLSQCLLSAGLARSAVPIIREWAARYSADEEWHDSANTAARMLARFAHWAELEQLGTQPEAHAVVRFYAALAAQKLGHAQAAQHQYEALFFTQRARDMAHFARSDALTLQAGYNLALSYAAQGQTQKAISVLDDIGRLPAEQGDAQHVVDMANLKLGWMLLGRDQAASAKPVFRRMSLSGPFSRMALLGLGWSGLLPAGQAMTRVALEYPEVKPVSVDTSALAVWVARWRVGEISCSALLAATERMDLCSPTTALPRDAGTAQEAINPQQQMLAAWAELRQRPAHDLISIELLLGLSQLVAALDRDEQSLALLQHTETQINALAERLAVALQLAENGDAALWQQTLPALQMWLRSGQGYGLLDLARQLEQFNRHAVTDGADEALQALATGLHLDLYQGAQAQLRDMHEQLLRYELDLRVRLARQLDRSRNG